MRRRSIIRVVAALIVACGLSARAQAIDLSGCWSGSWQSCSTGHAGVLRATFTRCDDTHYRVDFSGRFFKILPFRYSVTLQVVEETEETVKLSGSSYPASRRNDIASALKKYFTSLEASRCQRRPLSR